MKNDLLRARYVTFALLGLVLTFYLSIALNWSFWLAGAAGFATAAALVVVLEIWTRLFSRRAAVSDGLRDVLGSELRIQTQLALVFQQKIIEACSERDILEATLQTGGSLLHAQGASFVPFDEYAQSLPALMQGDVPASALQTWSARLKMPETRTTCKNCQVLHGGLGCVLIPTEVERVASARCFPLMVAGREAGVVNFFFPKDCELASAERIFLIEILFLAGQALENLRSRDQEIIALRYLQTVSAPKSDLTLLLNNLLENVQRALDTDFALLYLPGGLQSGIVSAPVLLSVLRSDSILPIDIPDQTFLDGLWQSALKSGQSISLENVNINNREMWKVLLTVPLVWHEKSPAGVMVLGSNSSQAFAPRQRVLLETLAAQAALLIQNARLMVQVEYQAVVDERARLAREIHDGLAQTLAFLKIQAAQMQSYLSRGELDRLTNTLQANYRTLSDAYLDARQAIDNLRRTPASSLRDWVGTVIVDFEQGSGLKVELDDACLDSAQFAPNVQAQLIRIVQEAFSNIRKHAQASHVWLIARKRDSLFFLAVRDDGSGFQPEQIELASRYGLRGMRERADGIGADFQIISRPGEGTTISLSLPVSVEEEL